MSGFRLNGWQRIGIMLSVLWAFVGAFWGWKIELDPYYESLRTCLDLFKGLDSSSCWESHQETIAYATPGQTAALVALLPIPIVWLLVYGFIGLFRWIRRGFQPST